MLERYYFAIDAKDEAIMCSCFAKDALIVYHTGEKHEVRLNGHAELMKYLHSGIAWNGPSIHALSNSVVKVTGANTAKASAYAIAHLVVEGKVLVRGLRYDDSIVRQGESWVIKHRDHRSVWQYEAQNLPSHLPGR